MNALLEDLITKANDEKLSGRFKKYEFFETLLDEKFHTKNLFKDKIPILVNGLSIDHKGIRDGLDPYSNNFAFSNNLLALQQGFEREFLEKLLFIYLQPITYTQQFKEINDELVLEDLLFEECEKYNDPLSGIGFGTLRK